MKVEMISTKRMPKYGHARLELGHISFFLDETNIKFVIWNLADKFFKASIKIKNRIGNIRKKSYHTWELDDFGNF